jgi:hypothetical protein
MTRGSRLDPWGLTDKVKFADLPTTVADLWTT